MMFSKIALAFLLVVIGASVGCSRHPTLGRQIAAADHVLVSNIYNGFTVTLTGPEAREVMGAVSYARKHTNSPDMAMTTCREFWVTFFAGTNTLAAVDVCGDIVGIDRTVYMDHSGVLKRMQEKAWTVNSR